MFSGIVETIGQITATHIEDGCKHFTFKPAILFNDVKIGDSVSVNGVCLTVTQCTADTFNMTAVPETLRLTNLGKLNQGDIVNLERSITMATRIGGHQVQGHVDGTGTIIDIQQDNSTALLVKIAIDTNLAKYIVNKGYITLDGMSITVIDVTPTWFTVTFIPHTQAVTIVNQYKISDVINIEVDILAKYLEKWLQPLMTHKQS